MDALFALHSSAYVLRYWDAPPWTEPERAERFVAACRQMAEEGSGARLAMDRVSDGAFIGWCGLTRWNPDYRSASMSYCLDDAAWGDGYATEAAGALLQWAFDTLDLNRVQAETDTRNAASARVLEKLGFVVSVYSWPHSERRGRPGVLRPVEVGPGFPWVPPCSFLFLQGVCLGAGGERRPPKRGVYAGQRPAALVG